jgi:hypothetical protein
MAADDRVDSMLEPHGEDSSDVRWALETALAMWSRGDRDQALRWVDNAVAAAERDGAEQRATDLGRARGELAERPPPRPATVPSVPASITERQAGPPTAPLNEDADGPATHKRPDKMLTAPYKIAPDEVTNLFAPDSELLEAMRAVGPETVVDPAAAISETPAPKAKPARPRPPPSRVDALDATMTNFRPEPPADEPHEHTVVMDEGEAAAPSRSMHTAAPSTMGSPQTTIEPMRALRVVIQSGSGRELVLRLLDEGEAPPNGAQEALLIALGRDNTSH